MRKGHVLASIAASVMLASGAVATASAQDSVNVGIVVEVTGGGAPAGTMYRDGVILGIEEINAAGGILGKKIEYSVADTQSDPPTSVAVMRRTVADKPFAIFGTVYSSSTVANMSVAQQAGVPQFSGSESAIIVSKGNPNVFLTSFSQEMGFRKLVNWVVKGEKAEKVALIYVNNAFGIGGRDVFKKYMKELGKDLVAEISTEVQQADFTAELTEVKNSGATHVMIYSHEEENARMMIQMRKMGLNIQALGDNLCAATTINAGGDAVNGAKCHVSMTAQSPIQSMKDVGVKFQKKFGRESDHNGFKGYIGIHLLKAAVERVGAWDQQKVRDCLHNNLFTHAEEPGLMTDTFVFDNGDADRPSFIVEVKNGKNEVSEVVDLVGGPYKKHECK